MKKRQIYLFAVFYALFTIFLPDMVPGSVGRLAEEGGFSLVDYAGYATFPEEFSRIQDPRQRKLELIDLLLPLVLKANEDILSQRHELKRIRKSRAITHGDGRFIEELARIYLVKGKGHRAMLDELLLRVDVLPASLVLAQAAIESGWGTSRFALEGNNIFGLRGPGGLGMTPAQRNSKCGFTLSAFGDLQECVSYYLWNINTHENYEGLRRLRARESTRYDPLLLARCLDGYSEMGSRYVARIVGMIRENNLTAYDAYRLRSGGQRTARVPGRSFRPAGIS
jgi:Bax protein